MNQRLPTLAVTMLVAVVCAPGLFPDAAAQDIETDLAVTNVAVENAVFETEDPANVTVTVLNNGSSEASGVAHFRYNTTNRSLTDDGRSDQPFNSTEPLEPGETVNITISWRPTVDQIGPGHVLGFVSSASDSSPDNDRANATVFVERYALEAQVLADPEPLTLPARTTGFRVVLENTGNAPFHLGSNAGEALPPGWSADAPVDERRLATGEKRMVYALVTPPDEEEDDLPDGTSVRAEVEWFAEENPIANTTLELPNATVQRDPPNPYRYGVKAEIADGVLPTNRHAVTETMVNVTNAGNVTDVFSLDITTEGPLTSNLTVRLERSVVVLPPNASVQIPLETSLDGSPPASRRANVTVEASSVNSRFEPDASDATSAEARVASPDATVEAPTWPRAVYQRDGTAAVEVTVRNAGQGPFPATNLTVQAIRGGFPFAETEAEVPRLAAGDASDVSVDIPVANLSGAYDLRVQVDPQDLVEEPAEEDNTAAREVFVRSASLSLEPADGIEAVPGQFVRYERPPHAFYVHNRGNAPENVTIQIESERGWISETRSLTLDEGAREPVTFSFVVPETPGTETDELHVHARLDARQAETVEATTTTRIDDSEPPRLLDADVPSEVTATQTFPVRSNWTDAVGVANVSLVLVSPSNSTNTVDLSETAPGVWEGNATVFELGAYAARFRATDASSQANVFEQETPLSLAATYQRSPVVAFTDPPDQRATRAGDPIPFDVRDPAGIATVTYEAAGNSGELSAPFQVPTDGWRNGEVTVTVTVENRYGLVNTSTANYTVDNTPPSIERLDVRPEVPAPGDAVTFTVETDASAAGGHVELRADGSEVLVEGNLSGESEGRFTARLTAGEGVTDALVVVEDSLGNQATQEIALPVGNAAIPGWGTMVTLAVASVVGLALARTRGD